MLKKKYISLERVEWDAEPDVEALEHAATLRFVEAEGAFKDLIGKGSILSMANLGHQYEYRPHEQGGSNYVQAGFWYRNAIDSGSAIAALPFGYFCLRRKNYDMAREIFSIGSERKYAPAFVRLADLYIDGIGVDRDYDKARNLLENSSRLGNLWAKRALARMDINLGKNPIIRMRGLIMRFIADTQFYVENKNNQRSERLKK